MRKKLFTFQPAPFAYCWQVEVTLGVRSLHSVAPPRPSSRDVTANTRSRKKFPGAECWGRPCKYKKSAGEGTREAEGEVEGGAVCFIMVILMLGDARKRVITSTVSCDA